MVDKRNVKSEQGHAAGRDVQIDNQRHHVGAMHGATNIVGQGITVHIFGPPTPQGLEPPQRGVYGLGEFIGDVQTLRPGELRSFSKWVRTTFGDLALHELEAPATRRIESYLDAIRSRRG